MTLIPGALGPWDTGSWYPGPWNWDSGRWDSDTQDPGNGSLRLWNCNPETQNPESRTVRIELVTQIPSSPNRTSEWINFNCEANFDNKKLAHLSQKLRCSSRWSKTFTNIFWHSAQHKKIRKYLKVIGRYVDQVCFVEKGNKRQELKFSIS